ncbi:hypothetical protein CKO35_05245 [Ectothiorhodospira shaposhnikovii]|uniref:PilW family protein n=1 Tax=Ectothiorhodospira shaposhnikovii TaxID=1054 RepID=UPI001905DB83|nr:PilW family protein [Ectothiorhodospira shaposhnikovii]MBK1672714.1 hypothetical protein [Ectothiorhodospira shaposhnikovii]
MNSITHRSAPPAGQQRGLSLVELMVALLIALILTGGVIQIFVSSSQTYRQQEALSRVQENTRFIIDTLQRELREAGNYGCVSSLRMEDAPLTNPRLRSGLLRVTLNNPAAWQWNFARPVEGYRGTGGGFSPALPMALPGVRDDSDVLTVRGMTGAPLAVDDHPTNATLPPGATPLQIAPGNDIAQGDILLANNCTVAAVFQVTNADPGTTGQLVHDTGAGPLPGNYTQALGANFGQGSDVMRVSSRSYYIANGANGRPALFRILDAQAAGEELVEGVERMRIAFGVDDTGNLAADRFLNPQQVDNQGLWESVVAVRVTLLMASTQQGVIDQPQQINFDGEVFTPDDRRLRLVVSTTIGLRNRLP